MPRASWDDVWVGVAQAVAQRSRCARDQIGAVVVSSTQRIVATGFNGPPAGYDSTEYDCSHFCTRGRAGPTEATAISYADCVSIHAEANALLFCDRRDREGGTIYTTSHVCWSCAKLVANSGLARVVVAPSAEHSYRSPSGSYGFLEASGLEVVLG